MYELLTTSNFTAHFQILTENIFKIGKHFQRTTPLLKENKLLQNFQSISKIDIVEFFIKSLKMQLIFSEMSFILFVFKFSKYF